VFSHLFVMFGWVCSISLRGWSASERARICFSLMGFCGMMNLDPANLIPVCSVIFSHTIACS